MEWGQVASHFDSDSSLRDIFIDDTILEDWQKVLDTLRELDPGLAFFRDHEPSQLPERAADMFSKGPEFGMLIKVNIGGIHIHCHPIASHVVEFDIVRDEIDGPERLTLLVGFMDTLANATRKVVTLAHDGDPEAVIGRAHPTVPQLG